MDKQDHPSFYAIIPATVRYNKNLCANAKLLFGEITALCNKSGECWASNEYFSKLYNVSITSISKWITQLVDENHIQRKMRTKVINDKKVYDRSLTLVKEGLKEKLKNNSTLNISFNKLKDEGFEKSRNFKINEFTYRIIKIWNNNNTIPIKHKIDKKTKLQKNLQKYLLALKNGVFNDVVDLDPDFLQRNYITRKYLIKKYSEDEIINIFKNTLLLYKVGYWPQDKTKLPKSVDQLFYNPGYYSTKKLESGGSSWFIKTAVTKPRQLRKEKSGDEVDKQIEAKRIRSRIRKNDRVKQLEKENDPAYQLKKKRGIV